MTLRLILAACILIFHMLAIVLMLVGMGRDRAGDKVNGSLFWGLASLTGIIPFGIIWYYIQGTEGNLFFGVITGICALCGIFFLWHSRKLKTQEKGEV
jgi:FtsH-binding integral membrane protein